MEIKDSIERQRILITNDDGIYARGLRSLIEVASNYGDVIVVAPELPMSGKSHSITMESPLMLRKIRKSDNVEVYACQGTPVDCTKLAIDYLMKDNPPTLVLSGINHGANSNTSVIYSGTMGAATEGAICGIPSIGLSLLNHNHGADMTTAKAVARIVIESVIKNNENKNLCLNVNVPDVDFSEIKGFLVCRQSLGCWIETFEKRTTPNKKEYFWLSGDFHSHEGSAVDNDEWALKNNYVSVVPVQTDMTDYNQLKNMNNWEFEM